MHVHELNMSKRQEHPVACGYSMPAEWARHQQTWMGWPQRPDNWRDHAKPAQKAWVDVVTAISQFEPVTVCANADQVEAARAALPAGVQVEELPQNDAWFRDSGPIFVVGASGLAAVDWEFNAWGGDVLPSWELDNQIAQRIAARCGVPVFNAGMILEGGSIHVDGEGTLMTTEECLLNPNRNPTLNKAQIEQHLKDFLGVQKIIWLPLGLYNDVDTNGHVDNFACFAEPGVVLLGWPQEGDDKQLERSQAALDKLNASTDAKGRSFKVIRVPLPPPLFYTEEEVAGLQTVEGAMVRPAGDRLAASYVNFYLPNGGVVMPAFGGDARHTDAQAKKVLQEAFPDRIVVAVSTRDILLGGGNIHCITQQQPLVKT